MIQTEVFLAQRRTFIRTARTCAKIVENKINQCTGCSAVSAALNEVIEALWDYYRQLEEEDNDEQVPLFDLS